MPPLGSCCIGRICLALRKFETATPRMRTRWCQMDTDKEKTKTRRVTIMSDEKIINETQATEPELDDKTLDAIAGGTPRVGMRGIVRGHNDLPGNFRKSQLKTTQPDTPLPNAGEPSGQES